MHFKKLIGLKKKQDSSKQATGPLGSRSGDSNQTLAMAIKADEAPVNESLMAVDAPRNAIVHAQPFNTENIAQSDKNSASGSKKIEGKFADDTASKDRKSKKRSKEEDIKFRASATPYKPKAQDRFASGFEPMPPMSPTEFAQLMTNQVDTVLPFIKEFLARLPPPKMK